MILMSFSHYQLSLMLHFISSYQKQQSVLPNKFNTEETEFRQGLKNKYLQQQMKDQREEQIQSKNEQNMYKKIGDYVYSPSWKVGSGAFSSVYRGIDTKTNMSVAIKIIKKQKINTQIAKHLLSQEITIMRQLNSQYLIHCIDVITTMNNVHIITDFCKFGDLSCLLAMKRQFQEKQISSYVFSMFMGLKYLAEKSIIHRDFKTANVFVCEDGRAKIGDFGFAVKTNQMITDINLGSPFYMAPQSVYFSKYCAKTDVWALGIIIYQLITGSPPLVSATSKQQIREKILLPHPAITANISSELRSFISRCLTINPQHRISVSEMENHQYIRRLYEQNEQKMSSSSTSMLDTSNAGSKKSAKSSNLIYQTNKKQLMYDEGTSLLHYCRLVSKLCQCLSSTILEQWVLRVIYDLHRTKLKENQPVDYVRYYEIIQKYYNRYSKQFKYNGNTVTIQTALKQCEQLYKKQVKFKKEIMIVGTQTNTLQQALSHPLKLLYFSKKSKAATYMS